MSGRRVAAGLGVVAVYAAAVAYCTWPLPRVAANHLPDPVGLLGGLGWPYVQDIQHHAWGLAWLGRVLPLAPWALYDAPVFHPAPDALAYTEHFLGHAPVAVPAYLLTRNPVLTFNAVLLSCYLGCALAMHALARRWTGSTAAAFAAGLAYALNARRLPPSFWLEYAGGIWLPLLPLVLERWAAARRPRTLVALAALLTLQTLCSYYLGYAAFLLAGIVGLVLLARHRLGPAAAAGAGAAAVVAAGLVALVSEPYLRLHAGGALPPVTMLNAEIGAFRPATILPGGHWFVGWSVAALALLGLVRPLASGGRGTAAAIVAGSVLLALGPYARGGGVAVPLPYRWLWDAVPGFAAVRFPVLLLTAAEVGLAALVGGGVAAAVAGARRAGRGAAVAVALALPALVGWELAARARVAVRQLPVGDALPAVYRALAAEPPGGAVLELPIGGGGDPRGFYRDTLAMVLGTYHWRPLVNGYSDFAPATYEVLSGLARRLPEREALATLRDADVRWLVVHAPRLGPGWTALERDGALRTVLRAGDDTLYEVMLPPRRDLAARLRADLAQPPERSLDGTPLTPLPAGALDGAVAVQPLPSPAFPGKLLQVHATVRNASAVPWPAFGVHPRGLVVVELRWVGGARAADGPPDAVWRLPRDLSPGESVAVGGRIAAPRLPARYELHVRLRQDLPDGRSGPPARVPLTVEAPPALGAPAR